MYWIGSSDCAQEQDIECKTLCDLYYSIGATHYYHSLSKLTTVNPLLSWSAQVVRNGPGMPLRRLATHAMVGVGVRLGYWLDGPLTRVLTGMESHARLNGRGGIELQLSPRCMLFTLISHT